MTVSGSEDDDCPVPELILPRPPQLVLPDGPPPAPGELAPGGPLAADGGLGGLLEGLDRGSLEKVQSLSPGGRAYLISLVEPYLRAQGNTAAIEALYAQDYERVPPTPEAFLDSTDYVAHAAKDLFPAWRPVFLKACDPSGGIYELDITGAQSLGKTTIACFILAYKLARLFCLRDAAAFYGLQARTKIYFGLYALTKRLIKQVGFYDLRDQIIDPSPFFRDVYPRAPHGNEYIRWPQKNVEVITGSSELHAIGRALFAVLADELNFFAQGEKTASRAADLVAEVSRRLEGRFVSYGGDIPGIAIYISQTRTTSDYLEQRIREKKGTPGVMVARGPRWAFNTLGYDPEGKDPRRGFVPGDPTFRVYVGSETADPRVLDRVARKPDGGFLVEPVNPDEEAPEDGVLHVPITHYRAHVDDLHGALRNIDDVPTGSFMPFFPRREVVEATFDDTLPFPFSGQVLACYEGSPRALQESFDHRLVTRVHMGRLEPTRHPQAPRYIHLDLAQGGGANDRAGMVMVHPSDHTLVEREGGSAEVGEGEVVKNVEVDFHIALVGGPYGEPIDFRAVRVFIEHLRRIGFWIRLVTADQFQSFDFLQRLREMGFQTDRESMDRAPCQPYRDLRQAANEGRVSIPWPPVGRAPAATEDRRSKMAALTRVILFQELTGLEHDVKRDKVDHRAQNPDGSKGSKDIADGLAGAVFRCLGDVATPGEQAAHAVVRAQAGASLNRYLDKAPF